jgi:FkbM family methyltransferase
MERQCKGMYVANSDMSAPANSLRLNLPWEPWMLPLIQRSSNLEGMGIDIGAHIGVHTVSMAPYFKTVLAFEPNPPSAQMLRKNVAPLSNVTVVQAAVGNYDGEANFNSNPMNCQSQVVTDLRNAIAIKMIKLDNFIDSNAGPVSFIKIDVEGYEIAAFKGMQRIIENNHPVIVFEDHTGDNCRFLSSSFGYKIARINNSNFIASLSR